jgi:hypothetical protein
LTTDRQQRANRANAKSSTGPKSAPGKARSAQNAMRHGLNVSVLSDPALAPLAEEMARKTDAEAVECARQIAEAQIDLNRVRDSRRRLIAGFLIDPKYQPLPVLRQQLRLMKMIDRVERLRSAPFKASKSSPLLSRRKHPSLPHSTGTNDALCRDASSRSASSMRTFAATPGANN